METDEKILIEAGLSEEQALVYGHLLDRGPQRASALSKWLGIKRGLVYKVLEQLGAMNLVEKKGGAGTVALFSPLHPSHLLEMIESRAKSILLTKETLTYSLGSLASKFNLLSGKPNVQFYEGKEGVRSVLWDTLNAKEIIYTFADIEAITKYIPKINDEYSELREKKNIVKKALLLDTIKARELINEYHTKVTEIKFISPKIQEFQTVIQIYDNKISYITLKDDAMIGIIIEDPYIYDTHRKIFEYLWEITKTPQDPS